MTQTDSLAAAPAAVSGEPAPHGRLRRALDVVGVQNAGLVVALIVLCAVIGSRNSNLFLVSNIKTMGSGWLGS